MRWRECGNSSQILTIMLRPFTDPFLFFIPVKYMREATPYVTKGSPVSEIGWETPPPESPRLGSPHFDIPSPPSLSLQGDRRYIPLKMCYITRSMTIPDPENRYCFSCISYIDHRKFAKLAELLYERPKSYTWMFKTLKKHLINIKAKKINVCVLCTNIMDFVLCSTC